MPTIPPQGVFSRLVLGQILAKIRKVELHRQTPFGAVPETVENQKVFYALSWVCRRRRASLIQEEVGAVDLDGLRIVGQIWAQAHR